MAPSRFNLPKTMNKNVYPGWHMESVGQVLSFIATLWTHSIIGLIMMNQICNLSINEKKKKKSCWKVKTITKFSSSYFWLSAPNSAEVLLVLLMHKLYIILISECKQFLSHNIYSNMENDFKAAIMIAISSTNLFYLLFSTQLGDLRCFLFCNKRHVSTYVHLQTWSTEDVYL